MNIDDEVKRATKLLETVMQGAGATRKLLDQKLRASPGHASQVLTGRIELKYRHVLAILDVLNAPPGPFFQALFPDLGTVETDVAGLLRHYPILCRGRQAMCELEEFIRSVVKEEVTRHV